MLTLIRTTAANPDFRALVRQLDQYLAHDVNGSEHAFYDQFNQIENLNHVVLAYHDAQPVGCGAFRELTGPAVEIKRMFVRPDQRQRGVAQAVLRELEAWAAELGFAEYQLETSRRMLDAVRLYERSGYRPTPNYGPYVGVEDSVCMRKRPP